MNELFIEEFNITGKKESEEISPPTQDNLPNETDVNEQTSFEYLKKLDHAIRQESQMPERYAPFLDDLLTCLDEKNVPKALYTIDLIEEFFDLELR